MTEANENEMAKHMALLEAYKEQIGMAVEQSQLIQAMINDYMRARVTIEQFSKNDENTNVLFPVGGGVFVNADAKNTGRVLLDVGAGIVMEKTVDDATKKIDERVEVLRQNLEKLSQTVQKLQDNASEITNKLQGLSESQDNY